MYLMDTDNIFFYFLLLPLERKRERESLCVFNRRRVLVFAKRIRKTIHFVLSILFYGMTYAI